MGRTHAAIDTCGCLAEAHGDVTWRPDFQRDFAKRMAWCVPGKK
jgi:hypothetical protein